MKINVMVRVSEPLHAHLLRTHALINQRVSKHSRVLEMHIVVAGSMLDEEAAGNVFESGGLGYRGGVVARTVGG